MAKRKNPLQDIDAFLSQEATNLVKPDTIPSDSSKEVRPEPIIAESNLEDVLKEWMKTQGEGFRTPLYDVILKTLENAPSSTSKDKMLINTLLYLKNPDSWKDVIKEYWS